METTTRSTRTADGPTEGDRWQVIIVCVAVSAFLTLALVLLTSVQHHPDETDSRGAIL